MTLIMGVVNTSPDSFSGDGLNDPHAAVQHGLDLVAQGADLLDVGAESTRPGFTPIAPSEQIARLRPVVEGLADAGVPVSVDTTSAMVAYAGLAAGATMINDVSGGLGDEAMLGMVAACVVDFICGWWPGFPSHELSAEVGRPMWRRTVDELLWRRDACMDAGVPSHRIVLDPGLGFGKSAGDNWQILAHIDAITDLGHRVLIGASRKRFLDAHKEHRDVATAAVTAWCAGHGVWAVRVHDVEKNRQTVAVMDKVMDNQTKASR